MDPLGPGRIFWDVFPGPRGEGKTRPMVILTRRTDLVRTGRVFAVVCSTEFDPANILPAEVPLPSDPDGRCATRLRHPTVAVCDWSTTFPVAGIAEDRGIGGAGNPPGNLQDRRGPLSRRTLKPRPPGLASRTRS